MNWYEVIAGLFIRVSSFYVFGISTVPEVIQGVSEQNDSNNMFVDEHTSNSINKTTECPLWFLYNSVTKQCECGDELHGIVHCDHEIKRVYIIDCYCMTHDNHVGTVVGSCSTNCEVKKSNTSFGSYSLLPSNIAQLNKAMCGQRWNRSGRFCGKCEDDYYQSVYSYDFGCMKCTDSELRLNWMKYVTFAFVPLTVFYVLLLVCRINAGHPIDGSVISAQYYASPANVRIVLTAVTTIPKAAPFIHIVATLYGVWNLDFFRTVVPSTCLKINTLQALTLDYTIAFYPLFLVIISYILIELHDNGCLLIVYIWKPVSKCFRMLNSSIDIKSSVINSFSTFLLLSYIKVLSVTFDLLVPVWAHDARGNHVGTYLYYDANVVYMGKKHLPYAVLALFVMITFIILPILFLIAYPFQCCKFLWKWPALRICVDTYQGYYKDGTSGTSDCRWFSCVYLIVRIFLFVVFSFVKNSYFYLFAALGCLVVAVLLVAVQPFKRKLSTYNKVHPLLTLNMAVWFITVICIDMSSLESVHTKTFSVIISGFTAVIPLVYASVLVLQWIYVTLCRCFQFRNYTIGP